MTGIYIHVPFCLRKCPYCNFYSKCADESVREKYTDALVRNILNCEHKGIDVDTVYFGGGTPSLLTVPQIERVLKAVNSAFNISQPEITAEANPSSVNYDYLAGLRDIGVNRISFGIQSAVDSELEFLGRLHSCSQGEKAVLDAEKAGFDNISADLMIGLKGQTMESLDLSLQRIIGLPVTHISAYMLKIEEGTAFDCPEVRNSVADDDLLADMYLHMVDKLEKNGFEQYEISNFAKDKKYSKHNLKYWQCEEYLGFGASAHSFWGGERYFCPDDIKGFIEKPIQEKVLTQKSVDKLEEYIMLGLRLKKGISLSRIAEMSSSAERDRIEKIAEQFSAMTLCDITGDSVSLTPKGFLVSNTIIGQMLYECGL